MVDMTTEEFSFLKGLEKTYGYVSRGLSLMSPEDAKRAFAIGRRPEVKDDLPEIIWYQ